MSAGSCARARPMQASNKIAFMTPEARDDSVIDKGHPRRWVSPRDSPKCVHVHKGSSEPGIPHYVGTIIDVDVVVVGA